MLVGAVVPYMDGAIIVKDFTKWVGLHIRAFAGAGSTEAVIAAISEKPKTVYFPRQTNDLAADDTG